MEISTTLLAVWSSKDYISFYLSVPYIFSTIFINIITCLCYITVILFLMCILYSESEFNLQSVLLAEVCDLQRLLHSHMMALK